MIKLKATTVGSSSGVVLPEEVLVRLNVSKGDKLYLTEETDGGYRISTCNPESAKQQLEIVDSVMREDKEVLRALAE